MAVPGTVPVDAAACGPNDVQPSDDMGAAASEAAIRMLAPQNEQ